MPITMYQYKINAVPSMHIHIKKTKHDRKIDTFYRALWKSFLFQEEAALTWRPIDLTVEKMESLAHIEVAT